MALFSFDLDDTLVKSFDEVFKVFNQTLKDSGMATIGAEEYSGLKIWKDGERTTV